MSADQSLLGSVRLPPSNLEAEQALLGSIICNNKAFNAVSGFLRPEHFAAVEHAKIFQAISRRIEAGQLADAVTLRADFEGAGILDQVGGTAYLAKLISAMVGIANAGDYGRVVHDMWLRRQLVDVAEGVARRACGDGSGMDAIQQVSSLLD